MLNRIHHGYFINFNSLLVIAFFFRNISISYNSQFTEPRILWYLMLGNGRSIANCPPPPPGTSWVGGPPATSSAAAAVVFGPPASAAIERVKWTSQKGPAATADGQIGH